LQETLKRIREDIGGHPTVIDTGNGYHIYQPIQATILNRTDGLKEYTNFDKYYLPNKFMKFAEQYFTDEKGDHQHSPAVKSCLMRIPWTINSKCNREVSILQEWDRYRPSVASLLPVFRRHMSSQREISNQNSVFQGIHSTNSKSISNQNKYGWIDALLKAPVRDYRKYAVWRILAPYLVNVKGLDNKKAYYTIMSWLDGCSKLERLSFYYGSRVRDDIRRARKVGYYPISLSNLQKDKPELFEIIQNGG
jgi:hypothetical protein